MAKQGQRMSWAEVAWTEMAAVVGKCYAITTKPLH